MKKFYFLASALLATMTLSMSCSGVVEDNYVVLASGAVQQDAEWMKVAETLSQKHDADLVFYDKAPREVLAQLQKLSPRYVAIVDKPENLNKDFVIDMHHVSREVDEDIYADFMWGMITGYDAAAAMKMLDNSTEPLLIKDAVATITELKSAKWFDRYAWVDDHSRGLWGQKQSKDAQVESDSIDMKEILKKFTDLYEAYDPDLVVTAAHATQRNLEMPFSLGNLRPKDGKLYADDRFTQTQWDLKESGKRRVYFAVGNCLIGDVNNTKESMAIAWMNGSNAATMIGYVVTTWHGRNGWGGLKYWVTNPDRYTLAEAVYMNQQDFLHQQHQWIPMLIKENYPSYGRDEFRLARQRMREVKGDDFDMETIGFWHDRDVLAYYGDPKWEVRLQAVEAEKDYTVTSEVKGGKCIVTVTTADNFNLERMKGDKFKQEHVLDLPFSYFFPKRLKNPKLAEGQQWDAAVDENFLFVYNADFEPNKTYEIVIDLN